MKEGKLVDGNSDTGSMQLRIETREGRKLIRGETEKKKKKRRKSKSKKIITKREKKRNRKGMKKKCNIERERQTEEEKEECL
jgi:hypothetical protein